MFVVLQARQFYDGSGENSGAKNNNHNRLGIGVTFSVLFAGAFWSMKRDDFFLAMPKTYAYSGDDDDKTKENKGRSRYSNMNFIADIVEQVSKSVVFIESQVRHPFFSNQLVSVSSGSGFLVDKADGVILTNAHVIANTRQVCKLRISLRFYQFK